MKYIIELADDEVLVALKRPEDYEDKHPKWVSEDAIRECWPEYRTIHGDQLVTSPRLRAVDAASDHATMIEAFETYFNADSEDPSMEGELSIWEAAWKAAVGAQEEG